MRVRMKGRITGRQAVGLLGCAVFCLIVCVGAFWNRTLILEPVTAFLRGETDFEGMKHIVQENYLDDRFRGKFDLITLNGGFARLEGRTRYNSVQRMTNGMITSITPSMMDTTDFSDNLSIFCRDLESRGIPFLFVMEPFKLPVEENLLPTGITDHANDIADQVMAQLEERNVPALDLRAEMSRTRDQIEKYFYHTDHHWNVEGCFYAYQRLMEAIRERFPDTKLNYTDVSKWEKTVVPDFWLGSDGRRVGPWFAGADDLDYYLPGFDTEIARYSVGTWTCKGDFREANMREWLLEVSDYYNMDTYSRYLGGTYALTLHRNTAAENRMKLAVIRDSFFLPVECFLSTELTAVDVIDPRLFRSGPMSEADYLTLNPPDMVIMMIYPEIFPSVYYDSYFPPTGEKLEITGESEWGDISVAGTVGNEEYQVLPVRLEPGKCYMLEMDHIQVNQGEPDGANVVLWQGEELVDQTFFDIDYGNQFGYHWGFLVPEKPEAGGYELRFYAGVSGATDGMDLEYQRIRLTEGELSKPEKEDDLCEN